MRPTADRAMTLAEFNGRITALFAAAPQLRNVWVTAELSDVRHNPSGHCYLELIQKDPATGSTVARMRATIWSSTFARLSGEFFAVTGQRFADGIKVMVCLTASYHPNYGLSGNITDINPDYTMGDLLRLRREILRRLQAEGVLELNRQLEWPDVPLRIAVISAQGAAGYGDFIHQLYTSPARLRFTTRLFPASMQGDNTAPSIIAALEAIACDSEPWDGVVIIRGGGATSDLVAFDNYDLAANIAQFPLPVIIGIGHERDITVLDYVANMRVKTPTAAAEWLIARGQAAVERLDTLAAAIHQSAVGRIAGCRERLAYCTAQLPYLPGIAIDNARRRMERFSATLSDTGRRRLQPEMSRLDSRAQALATVTATIIERRRNRLDSIDQLIAVLSPAATLSRGYSITRVNGRAVTDASAIPPGTTIETTLATGTITSVTE